jgi:glycolate oxidase FAD binding subunit
VFEKDNVSVEKDIVSTVTHNLPISETVEPGDAAELAECVASCYRADAPVYPLGGETSLDFGLTAKRQGTGLSLARMQRVIDYPAADMTVTVEAGVTMQALTELLGKHKQQLPIDVPQPDRATVGGVVATNWCGPRRYGHGTVRDYVIGIRAVDGTGRPFRGGGRVVKNVAGYDFCKLLVGSMGTLGVITELTFKLKPLAENSIYVVTTAKDLAEADRLLNGLVRSETTPTAIELLGGPEWETEAALTDGGRSPAQGHFMVAVGIEGTLGEVDWMADQLAAEWKSQRVARSWVVSGHAGRELGRRLNEFSASEAPLVIKASIAPSGVTGFIETVRAVDAQCSIQAHAGSGIVIARFSQFPAEGLSRTIVGKLHPAAVAAQGSLIVLANASGSEMTAQSAWGAGDQPHELMTAVKRRFDPKNLLNPGRFLFP